MNTSQKFIIQNQRAYDSIAHIFSTTREYIWDDLKPLRQYTTYGNSVLDIGCGNGRLYQLFDTLSIAYFGLDQSKQLIDIAKKHVPEGNFVVGSMTSLPYDTGMFDCVYCVATFHHLPDKAIREKALKEMKRVLKPGGYVIMTNWNAQNDWVKEKITSGKYTDYGDGHVMIPWRNAEGRVLCERHYWKLSLGELSALFKTTGFRLEEQYFTKKGERSGIEKGENIVSVARVS